MTVDWAVVLVPAVAFLAVTAGVAARAVHPPPPKRPAPSQRVDRFGTPAPTRPSNHWPQTVHVWHHVVVEHHVAVDEAPAQVRGWIEATPARPLELPPAEAPEVWR